MKLLVTGGAGFIGSNFIRYFLSVHPSAEIVNFDKLTYAGNLQNLADIDAQPNYRFVRGDICDAEAVEQLCEEPFDAIAHFAAESHVDRSIAAAREFIRTNVEGTLVMLEAARKRKIPRFLHVSTDEVYGSMAPKESATEQSQLAPNSPYAASKAASDLLVRSYVQTHKFPAVITRCTNNYGPYQFPEKLIPLMISNAMDGKKLPVYGDGLNERDWIFVEDHCRALDAVLEKGRIGEIYNIGSGRPVPNIGIVRNLLKLLNAPDGLIEFVQDRPGHDRRYALDDSKIRRELGWESKVELDSGLKHTVDWYRSHSDWVQEAKTGEYQAYYEKFYVKRRATLAQL
ncbi:MAG: dTDP-glucose 4,6-dehydratase [Candidatus Acidiferrales bacterium]|jgi:dTDP-glucose 4,6-dehydratase|nr:dTDP-glucose 4,6-dehydratase [Candidatus Acidoferrales bacterium]